MILLLLYIVYKIMKLSRKLTVLSLEFFRIAVGDCAIAAESYMAAHCGFGTDRVVFSDKFIYPVMVKKRPRHLTETVLMAFKAKQPPENVTLAHSPEHYAVTRRFQDEQMK